MTHLNSYQPPADISKEEHVQIMNLGQDSPITEHITVRQKNTRQVESTSSFEEKSREFWMMSREVCDPAVRVLVAAVRWLHGVDSYTQLKRLEQIHLLCANWKELYILTAAQHLFFFDEGKLINHLFVVPYL